MIREGGGWGGGEEGYRGEERSEGIIVQYRNYHLVSSIMAHFHFQCPPTC